MRAPLQEGDFPFPVKYGYATVGTVESGPASLAGRTVFCLHPHQDRFVASVEMLRPVPDGVPPARAVLTPFMETALNIVWDARIAVGDRVAIVGAGLIGSLVGYLASHIPGTTITLVDPNMARLQRLEGWGCALRSPDDAPVDQDVVVHASGSAKGLDAALDCAGLEARVVEASWFGEQPVSIALGGAFHSRRLALVSSQVGRVPADRQARWSTTRRLDTALGLLADPALDRLFSGESAFADLDRHYAGILADPDTLCHRIRYAD